MQVHFKCLSLQPRPMVVPPWSGLWCSCSRCGPTLGGTGRGRPSSPPLLPQATLKGEDRTDAGAMANFFHQLLLHSTPTVHLVAPALLEGCE